MSFRLACFLFRRAPRSVEGREGRGRELVRQGRARRAKGKGRFRGAVAVLQPPLDGLG